MKYRLDKYKNKISVLGYGCMRFTNRGGKIDLDKAEKEIMKAQAINEGKPEAVATKIVEGKIEKYYGEVCLLEQDFIKDPDKKVQQVLTEKIANIGENITIRRFVRFERGEGIEKKQENFAEEVMKQING